MGDGDDSHDFDLLRGELATSVTAGGTSFCGVTLQEYAIGGVTHGWKPGSKLRVALDFDDLGALRASQVRDTLVQCYEEIEAACNLKFELISATLNANLIIKLARMDGASGVLADCGIPPQNADPNNVQLHMRIDTSERWGLSVNPTGDMIDLYRVKLHELLHFCGLGHQPASIREPALIMPMYSPSLRNLQGPDKSELRRRHGGPVVAPHAPLPPGGFPLTIPVRVSFDAHGGTYAAAGPAKRQPAAMRLESPMDLWGAME